MVMRGAHCNEGGIMMGSPVTITTGSPALPVVPWSPLYRDPRYTDLAKVFFIALALGFQGKHRGEQDREWLDFYRRELFRFIYQREPETLQESKHFLKQAYVHNIEESVGLKLPNPRRWVIILIFWQLILFLASYSIYTGLIEDLEQILNQILLEA